MFCLSLSILLADSIPLQVMYDNAGPGQGYDKLIILQPPQTYTGGFTQNVQSVCIQGNGAIIDIQDGTILVDGYEKVLDFDHCVFYSSTNNYCYILYLNDASGNIFNNTFYGFLNNQPESIALKFEECINDTSYIINNIFTGFEKVVYFYTLSYGAYMDGIDLYIENNLAWENLDDPWNGYGTYIGWGGWTGLPMPFIPITGNSELIEDPMFIYPDSLNFELTESSPCVDYGIEVGFSYNGNAPDIGALESPYNAFWGTKISGIITGELTTENSPYIIIDDITIPASDTLCIRPGVYIKINYQKVIDVEGKLNISGTESDSVYITNNSAYDIYWGNIIFRENSDDSSIIKHCTVEYGSYSWNFYGTISCLNDSITIIDNKFSKVGIIFCGSGNHSLIKNNIFWANTSFTGRCAVYCDSFSIPLIKENEFDGTYLYIRAANPFIYSNLFYGNNELPAQQWWIIRLIDQSDAIIQNNYLGNTHGGILINKSSANIVNNKIIDCDQGASFQHESNGYVYNNTLYNCSNFGVISSSGSCVHAVNNIIWSDTTMFDALRISGDAILLAEYNDLCTYFPGTGNIFEDPLFVDPTNFDLHLHENSPCINTGTPDTTGLNLPPYDLDGNPRIYGDRIDMGAYEWQGYAVDGWDQLIKQFYIRIILIHLASQQQFLF